MELGTAPRLAGLVLAVTLVQLRLSVREVGGDHHGSAPSMATMLTVSVPSWRPGSWVGAGAPFRGADRSGTVLACATAAPRTSAVVAEMAEH
jgi:hypothetical protein